MKRLGRPQLNSREYWEQRYTTEHQDMWRIWTTGDLIQHLSWHIPNDSSVLDVGGGCGIVAHRLQQEGFRFDLKITGLDFALAALRNAPQQCYRARVAANLNYYLPFKDKSFDVCMATEVMEHMDQPITVIGEMARVARKMVIISVPDRNIIDSCEHIWSINREDLVTVLGHYGADVSVEHARHGQNLVGVACKLL